VQIQRRLVLLGQHQKLNPPAHALTLLKRALEEIGGGVKL
jgi:hypothetical protein